MNCTFGGPIEILHLESQMLPACLRPYSKLEDTCFTKAFISDLHQMFSNTHQFRVAGRSHVVKIEMLRNIIYLMNQLFNYAVYYRPSETCYDLLICRRNLMPDNFKLDRSSMS